jgi:hypothetical protein
MWTDAAADAARCQGSGEPGRPAERLPDGYPEGRALCERCLRFIDLEAENRLVKHDTADETETDAEAARRREWFNAHGW